MNTQSIRPNFDASPAIVDSVSNPTRVAIRSAFNSVRVLDLEAQSSAVRQIVEIGGVKTHWSRPIHSELPPFRHIWAPDQQLLLVWREPELVIFGRRAASSPYEWLRSVSQHARVFESLPPYMFKPAAKAQPASPRQLMTLRQLLRLDAAEAMPELHVGAAAALINGFVVEPALTRLLAKFVPHGPSTEVVS